MPGILKTVNKMFPNRKRKMMLAAEIYNAAALQSRDSYFYSTLMVHDTNEGRFDVLSMHVALLLEVLKSQDSDLAQELFDYFMADMDYNLREMGVGDFSVGKHVKKLAQNFLGVLETYSSDDDAVLKEAFIRNVYANSAPSDDAENNLLNYFKACRKSLRQGNLEKGEVLWPKI